MELFWGHRDREVTGRDYFVNLDYLKALGINNLRVLVGADGKDGDSERKLSLTLQVEAGVYNDTIFDGLDFFLSELDKRDMYAVTFPE